jgi:hypothetical protein
MIDKHVWQTAKVLLKYSVCLMPNFMLNWSFGFLLLGYLAKYCSVIWSKFIRPF